MRGPGWLGALGPGLRLGESRRDRLAVLATGAAFVTLVVATTLLSGWHHRRLARLADESFARGEAALAAGRADEAVEAFETSLAHSREDPARQLRLAEALVAARRDDRARSHLLTLWAREPGSGVVNLLLARLASGHGRVEEAESHYVQAIHGSWDTAADPVAERRRVRLELVRFLLGRGLSAQAQSQLLALAPETPREAGAQSQLGSLFLGAGEDRRALEAFRAALALSPDHAEALSGAGEAAFRLGEYWNARRYLQRAARAGGAADGRQRLELTELVLSLDPFLPRLSSSERARRTVRAWEAVTARVEACASQPSPAAATAARAETLEGLRAALEEERPRVTVPLLSRDPDLVEAAMDRVFAAERDASVVCDPPQGPDLALRLIAEGRQRREQ